MAEQSTLSSSSLFTWNDTFFVVCSLGGSGGFAGGGGRASLDPDPAIQLSAGDAI